MEKKPVIYEITAIVRADLVERYEKYMLERHIPDLLETGCFRAASFTRSEENRYRIIYEADDKVTLERYLENEAPRLRADFMSHFPDGIEVVRDVWEILKSWQSKK